MKKEYDFSKAPINESWASMKWDKASKDSDIPMWVADMDFECAETILQGVQHILNRKILGYSIVPNEAYQAVIDWHQKENDWEIQKNQILFIDGLVVGLNVVCRFIQQEFGNADVFTPIPVYYHFRRAPRNNGLSSIEVSHIPKGNSWEMNFKEMEKAITSDTKLFQLCNPQNPLGRVFTEKELREVGSFCKKHDLYVMSDEVHMPLILDKNKKHIPFPKACPELLSKTIVLNSASKAFNIAGCNCAYLIIQDEDLKAKVQKAINGIVNKPNCFGLQAMISAYTSSGDWLSQAKAYLKKNSDYLIERIKKMEPLQITEPQEATYLAWVDCRDLPIQNPQAFFEEEGLIFSPGKEFGGEVASKFIRINFACRHSLLVEAMDRLEKSVKRILLIDGQRENA